MDNEEYLSHYGVLGMKWGVRRGSSSNSVSSKARKARKEARAANRNRKALSDKELDTRIARLEKEKKLNRLTQEELYPARTAVKSILKTSGSKALTAAIAGGLVFAGKTALSNTKIDVMNLAVDTTEAANYMFPNPNKKK